MGPVTVTVFLPKRPAIEAGFSFMPNRIPRNLLFLTLALWSASCSGEGGFSRTEDLTTPRHGHTATALGRGRVLVVGGLTKTSPLASMELYDLSKGSFVLFPSAGIRARGWHISTRLEDGKVLIIGGARGKGARYAEIYHPSGMRTRLVRTPTFAERRRHTATRLRDGRVLIAGGLGAERTLRGAELFDPARSTFTRLKAKMREPRQQHTATLLADGRVLFLGGWGNGKTLASGEIFDPDGSCFYSLPSAMRYERRFHSATPLGEKRILIAGGASDVEVLSAAELFSVPERGNSGMKCG